MRVIEIGKLAEKEISCDKCNSILAYTDADIQYEAEEFFGQWHDNTKIKCPICGNTIVLTVDGQPFEPSDINLTAVEVCNDSKGID